FYHLKSAVDTILQRLGIQDYQMIEIDSQNPYFAYGLSYIRNQKVLVDFGEINKKTLNKADVSGQVFYADFDWDTVVRSVSKGTVVYQEISKFPAVRRDLALLVDVDVDFRKLHHIAMRTERKLLKEV